MSLFKICIKKIFETMRHPELELIPLFTTCPWLVKDIVLDLLDYPEAAAINVLFLFPVPFLPLLFEGIQNE